MIGLIVLCLALPPVGCLALIATGFCGVYRMNRRRKAKAAERAAQRGVYWGPDTMTRRYYS